MNRIISLILSFVLIVSLFNGMPLNAFAAGETITATVQGEYQPSSAEQDVTIRINVNNLESPYCGFYIGSATLPDGFAIKSFSTSYTTQPIESRDYNLSTGKLTYEEANTEDNIPGDTYYEVVITVPANADGDYTIAFNDVEVGYDQGFEVYVRADEVNATLTISEPAAPAADYEVYYTLDKADGTDGDKYHEYGINDQVTATVYMKNNTDADVVMQAYDIYLTYSNKLSYASETMAGVALTANSNTAAAAGAAVSHIQLVKDTTTIALNDGQEVSLGTIVFDIVDTAVYGEALPITLTIGTSGKTVTNFAIASDETSYYPVNTGTVLGAEVNTTYTVSYVDGVDNETIDVPDDQTKYYNNNLTLSSTVPAREGYSFTGWSGSDSKTYQAGDTYATNAELTLTAQWQKNTVTIKWMNGTTQLGDDVEVEYGTVPSYSGTTPTKAADAQYTYTHVGWTTDPNGTTAGTLTAVTEDTTYYAVFSTTTNKYTVTWYNGENVLETDEDDTAVEYNGTPSYDSDEPTMPDDAQYSYEFKGWTTTENPAYNAEVVDIAGYKVTGNTKFYAVFTRTVNEYTVTFSTTQGTAPAAQTVAYDSKVEKPADLTADHYTFGGWYTDNTYATEYDFDTMTITGETTIYAKWTPKTYTVTFDANGGTGDMNPLEIPYGETKALTANAYSKTGYTFGGWTTNEDGTGTTYGDGANITLESNITLYAKWSENPHTITLGTIDNGTVEASAYSAKEGDTITLTATPNDGYEFVSYAVTGASGTAVTVTDGEFTMPNESVTVTATFKAKDLTVKVDSVTNGDVTIENGETDVTEKTDAHVDDTITLNVIPATGYKVKSVTYVKTGDDTAAAVNATAGENNTYTFTMPAYGVTVKAEFEAISYTIAFDGNGATSGSMNNITDVKYDADQKLTKNAFTKTGYDFAGWQLDSATYKDEDTVKNLTSEDGETVTLVAQWTAATYDITLNPNEGTINSGNVDKYTFGTGATLPTDITKTGHDFGGWYSDSNCTDGNEVTAISATEYGAKEYWAKWTPSEYTITYNSNGGSEIEDGTYTYGEGMTELPNPTKPGYDFVGWFDGDTKVESIATTETGDKALIAQWTAINYTITFDLAGGAWPTDDSYTDNKMTYTIESTEVLPTAEKAYYTFAGWKVTTADGNWTADSAINANTSVTGKYGNVTLTAQWNRAAAPVAEDYKYAASGYYMIRVADTLNDTAKEYKFNGGSMYWIDDSNYLVNEGDSGVFYYLVEEQYVDTTNKTLNDNGYALLSTGDVVNNTRAEIDYNGDVNGDGVLNIADANVVYQMTVYGGAYYNSLSIEQRLHADMAKSTNDTNNEYRGSIADVNVIVNEINGVTN